MPKIFGAKNLSADEIAVLLGFADAAAMVASIGQFVEAGGSGVNRTATPAIPWTSYVDGARITVRFPSALSSGTMLNVSGLGNKNISKSRVGSTYSTLITGGEVGAYDCVHLVYSSAIPGFEIVGRYRLAAEDIPSTLNTTTFGGNITLSGATRTISNNGSTITLTDSTGGMSAGYGSDVFASNVFGCSLSGTRIVLSNATAGTNSYRCGTGAGSLHSFFDKNGVEQLQVDGTGVSIGTRISSISGGLVITANSGSGYFILRSSETSNLAASIVGYSDSNSTYPGAHQQFAPLSTRAASTAIGLCPVATGDVAIVEIMEDGATNGVMAFVTGGAVYLGDLMPSFTKNAAYVVSSTPGAAEVGVYLSAGVLYIKPGASWTAKIGSFSKILKA